MDIVGILGWIGLGSTLTRITLRDVPIVRRTYAQIRVPHFIWRLVYRERIGIVFSRSTTLSREEALRVSKMLYLLHGKYKRLDIASANIGCLASPGQFRHNPSITLSEGSFELRTIIQPYVNEYQYADIDILMGMWSPYMREHFDSRILEVIQTSILVYLGYRINPEHILNLADFLEDFYLKKYSKYQSREIKFLDDLETSLEWLLSTEHRAVYLAKCQGSAILSEKEKVFENFLEFNRYLHTLRNHIQTTITQS